MKNLTKSLFAILLTAAMLITPIFAGNPLILITEDKKSGSEEAVQSGLGFDVDAFIAENLKSNTPEFSDISGHKSEDIILKYANLGIVSGYPDGTFKPDQAITRAELAKIIDTAFELKTGRKPTQTDVLNADGKWYYPHLFTSVWYIDDYMTPHRNEITAIYENNTGFLPESPMLRCHAASTFSKIHEEYHKVFPEIPYSTIVGEKLNEIYKDEEFHHLADESIKVDVWTTALSKSVWRATQHKIMTADENGYFRPYEYLTRAEALIIIDRIFQSETAVVLGNNGLTNKAKENSGLPEQFPIEPKIIGASLYKNRLLVWYETGTDMVPYVALEFSILGDGRYKFIQTHQASQSFDNIWHIRWLNNNMSFLIADEICKNIIIEHNRLEETVTTDKIPFVYNLTCNDGKYNIFFSDINNEAFDYSFSLTFQLLDTGEYALTSFKIDRYDDQYRAIAEEYAKAQIPKYESEQAENWEKIKPDENITVKFTNSILVRFVHEVDIGEYRLFSYNPGYLPDNLENVFMAGATYIYNGVFIDNSPKYLVFKIGREPELIGLFRCEFSPYGYSEGFYNSWEKFISENG